MTIFRALTSTAYFTSAFDATWRRCSVTAFSLFDSRTRSRREERVPTDWILARLLRMPVRRWLSFPPWKKKVLALSELVATISRLTPKSTPTMLPEVLVSGMSISWERIRNQLSPSFLILESSHNPLGRSWPIRTRGFPQRVIPFLVTLKSLLQTTGRQGFLYFAFLHLPCVFMDRYEEETTLQRERAIWEVRPKFPLRFR